MGRSESSISQHHSRRAVRSRILDLITSNEDPLVLMGDLNDEQQAASTAMFYGEWEPIVDSAPKPGDKIKFSVDKVNGQLTVMKIEEKK